MIGVLTSIQYRSQYAYYAIFIEKVTAHSIKYKYKANAIHFNRKIDFFAHNIAENSFQMFRYL